MPSPKILDKWPGTFELSQPLDLNGFAMSYPRFHLGYQHSLKLQCVLFEILIGIIKAIVEVVDPYQMNQTLFFLVGEGSLRIPVSIMRGPPCIVNR
jgi:hypothetical protein